MSADRTVVLAAGGTGGHIVPARAFADELTRRGWHVVVITDKRGVGYERLFPGIEVLTVSAASPSRGGPLDKAGSAFSIALGTLAARRHLRKIAPRIVVGFGGYPSLPAMLAARWLNIPTIIHEQNAVLGRVNRLLAPKAAVIATSVPETVGIRPQDAGKVAFVGNPVRAGIAAVRDLPYTPPQGVSPLRILVLGGSQGAKILSDVAPAAFASLPTALRRRLRITQQCRPEDIDRVRQVYAEANIAADLAAFIDDVPALMGSCHLAVSRAGASTIAELAVAGRPSILIPLASAMDDHQTRNAKALVAAGAAWMMPEEKLTPSALAQTIEALSDDPEALVEMATAAHDVGRPDAAARLADVAEKFLNGASSDRQVERRVAA